MGGFRGGLSSLLKAVREGTRSVTRGQSRSRAGAGPRDVGLGRHWLVGV